MGRAAGHRGQRMGGEMDRVVDRVGPTILEWLAGYKPPFVSPSRMRTLGASCDMRLQILQE